MKTIYILLLAITSSSLWAQEPETINWMTLEEAEAANKEEPRKVIIDVYTDWCGWCKRMDKNTFQQTHIAKYVNAHYYAVKLNAEQKEAIEFRNETFEFVPQGRRGYHQLAAVLLQGKMSYPSIVYLDENLNMIQPIPGYMSPLQFEQIIKYFGENHHKTTAFEDYKKNFKSETATDKS